MATLRVAPQNQARPDRESDPRQLIAELASESMFLEMLRRERHRTERSERPFLLVLISFSSHQGRSMERQARRITAAASSCLRDFDFLGWYKHPNTIGVLMPELPDTSSDLIERIVGRIKTALQNSLGPEIYHCLSLVVRVFPSHAEDPVFTKAPSGSKLEKRIDSAMKRAIDIVVSAVAILAFSPVFLTIAILVKCTSRGPVFFNKKRLGQYGREFSFFKFRTMYANNDPDIHMDYVAKLIAGRDVKQSNGLYKLNADPRVTPIGHFLRRNSLDELPQFFNVLLNDMSLVGPRPPLPYEYARYKTWHKRRVLELKPGITGLWQVEGRSRTTFDEMVRMDLHYAKTRNLWLDLKIMLRTPAAMISGQGAC